MKAQCEEERQAIVTVNLEKWKKQQQRRKKQQAEKFQSLKQKLWNSGVFYMKKG